MKFGYLHPDGRVTGEKDINPMNCRHFIMVGEHYRDDGSCRCDDPTHKEMQEWGYTWNGKEWS